jgi:hypothetical protein
MSFLKYFTFKSIGHYAAVIIHDIIQSGPKVLQVVNTVETSFEDVAQAFDPAVAPAIAEIQRAQNAAFGFVLDGLGTVEKAIDGTSTLTIKGITDAVLADYLALKAYFTNHAYQNGVSLPGAPVAAPASAVSVQSGKPAPSIPNPASTQPPK